ncbi:putative C-8 sterol isomerase [Trypanosoma grayi]|uniref:putative C-8 sterol isomerase n=1 Tax=Trypanosoma grayi TaxID=71804 RepID=UPI0004F3F3A8|nr:putative C-8 sterol isomerase [Trypanosoma grayi]KEG13943.1 putative C-8 sterol isomerase [Trypanosoma grayi]
MGKRFFIILSLVVILVAFCAAVDRPENWVFDPKTLKVIANRAISTAHAQNSGNATAQQIVAAVIDEVTKAYPVHATYTGKWMWNNAGGAMGTMTVLHCSLSEYLIIFGTSVGTEGHTGRYHWAEDFFTIIYGEQWASLPGVSPREVYKQGEQHYLPRSTAKQYRMPDTCWALEYARGNIPSMLFFGFADLFSSTLDVVALVQTVFGSAGQMIPNLLRGKI